MQLCSHEISHAFKQATLILLIPKTLTFKSQKLLSELKQCVKNHDYITMHYPSTVHLQVHSVWYDLQRRPTENDCIKFGLQSGFIGNYDWLCSVFLTLLLFFSLCQQIYTDSLSQQNVKTVCDFLEQNRSPFLKLCIESLLKPYLSSAIFFY